jgi:hypothetical protein
MTQLQVELQHDGQSLGWLPAGKLQPLIEASFVTEQKIFVFRLDHRHHLFGATEAQPD